MKQQDSHHNYLKRFDLYRNREGRPVRHWHEDTQLMMVDTGSAHLSVENTDFLLQEGDFLMIASRKGHAVLPGESRCCIVTGIMVDLSTMLGNHSLPDKIYGALFLEMNRDYLHIPAKDPANSRIRKIMSRIFEIEDDKPRSGSLEILGLLYQMLAVLLAYQNESYFIRLFSKQYGSTPRIYRQQSNRDSADNQTEYRGQAPGHR